MKSKVLKYIGLARKIRKSGVGSKHLHPEYGKRQGETCNSG